MTPSNALSSANSNQNIPATTSAPSTSTATSTPSASSSRPLYPRIPSSHPVKSSLPTPGWHDLPRLQLAPPEHQKQPHSQVKQLLLQQQHQEQLQQHQLHQLQQQTVSAPDPVPARSPQSLPSSRSVSPNLEDPDKPGGKRKSASANLTSNSKKRRTEQPPQHQFQLWQDYASGTQYHPYYPPPPMSTSPPNHRTPVAPTAHSPVQTSAQTPSSMTNSYSTFNEFQWRLLHLCSEFYEAATELIRSTPPPVLSQAFQLFDNGTGTDPISVLNDARKTCDMLLANPQALANPPPFPTPIPVQTLTSLLHMDARSISGPPHPISTHSPSLPSTVATPTYPSASAPPTVRTSTDPRFQEEIPKSTGAPANFTNIPQSGQVQGTWREHEITKLKELVEKYRLRKCNDAAPIVVSKEAEEEEETEAEEAEEEERSPTVQTEGANTAIAEVASRGVDTSNAVVSAAKKTAKDFDEIDWDQVVTGFGDERSRHQILIKATSLGLKPSSSLPGVKKKKKKKKKLTSHPFTQLLTNVALPHPAVSHGPVVLPPQILALTPATISAASVSAVSSGSAFHNANSRSRPGVGGPSPVTEPVVPRAEHASAASRVFDGGDSSLKSPAQSFSMQSNDRAASAASASTPDTTKPRGQATTSAAVPLTPTSSTDVSPATGGGIPAAYGAVSPWGYAPASAVMGQPGAGQGASPYYPYAGMYYSQGYPMQSYSIPGPSAISGVTPVPGASVPPPSMFLQTHPHYNTHAPSHAHPHAPIGQTFYAYVPRTEDVPGPKKTKKNVVGPATTATTATTPTASSTFIVPKAGNNASQKSADSGRPASSTPTATHKSMATESQATT